MTHAPGARNSRISVMPPPPPIRIAPPLDARPNPKLVMGAMDPVLASNRVSARDVMNTRRVVLTQAALEKLQEALG